MIYGVSKSRIRKLPEKMISINFLSINVDYVSIFIQESGACSFFRRRLGASVRAHFVCMRVCAPERERERVVNASRAPKPWRCTIYVI